MMVARLSSALSLMAILFCAGCGGNQIAQVNGSVKLDGNPVQDAFVEFLPKDPLGGGRPAVGKTDADGNYTLMLRDGVPGCQIGDRLVRISTADMKIVREGSADMVAVPERIPKKYNTESTEVRTVASGENVFDFDLKS